MVVNGLIDNGICYVHWSYVQIAIVLKVPHLADELLAFANA